MQFEKLLSDILSHIPFHIHAQTRRRQPDISTIIVSQHIHNDYCQSTHTRNPVIDHRCMTVAKEEAQGVLVF